MRIELERRAQPSALFAMLSPFIALGITLVAGVIMFKVMGLPPIDALYAFFIEPLIEVWSLHELAIKAAPLILIATGLAVCFRSSNWNIGAEGQFVMGAVAGSILPILFPEQTGAWVLPAMMIMGMAGGAAWGAIPAWLKNQFGANEILTSLMLVYVAQLILDWLVRGIWRDPDGYNFPESRGFSPEQILPEVLESGRAHYGAVFAIIGALVVWFMLARTMKGFEIKVIGDSPRAGQFAGFSAKRTTMFAFLIAGAFAGLAGISEVSGAIQQLRPVISPGYGFIAIIVAFLGRLNPLGIFAAGLILALSYLGSEAAQISLGISDKVGRVFQGLLLFFVLACDTLIHYRLKLVFSSNSARET
ncbi:MAG: sugar ABC transporter permease [Hyphomicrobiales bacterium]|nr:MAG: sugar ABC transporter permease [Hyphomicrobiales bacterium]